MDITRQKYTLAGFVYSSLQSIEPENIVLYLPYADTYRYMRNGHHDFRLFLNYTRHRIYLGLATIICRTISEGRGAENSKRDHCNFAIHVHAELIIYSHLFCSVEW